MILTLYFTANESEYPKTILWSYECKAMPLVHLLCPSRAPSAPVSQTCPKCVNLLHMHAQFHYHYYLNRMLIEVSLNFNISKSKRIQEKPFYVSIFASMILSINIIYDSE